MALTPRLINYIGDVDDHVLPVAEEIYAKWPQIAFIWGKAYYDDPDDSSQHDDGLALDFSGLEWGDGPDDPGAMRRELCDVIAQHLRIHRDRLNVWYIIWNRRIFSTNPGSYAFDEWTPYDGDNPHTDHVHVSLYDDRTYVPPTTPKDWFDMATEQTLETVVSRVVGGFYRQIKEYVARRTTVRFNADDMSRYGFAKDAYQNSTIVGETAKLARDTHRLVLDNQEQILDLLEGLVTQVAEIEDAGVPAETTAKFGALKANVADLKAEGFPEPFELEDVDDEEKEEVAA